MATEKFNELVGNIAIGLLNDAKTDDSYNYVLPLYELYAQTVETQDAEYMQMHFIAAIRNQPTFRECLRSRDTSRLQDIALQELPDSVGGSIKEVGLALSVPDLFREDAEKKMWSKIKKLVVKHCNLHDFVYGDGENVDTTSPVDMETKASEIRQERAVRFNYGYRVFLEQLVQAFPKYNDDESMSYTALEQFDAAVKENSESVIRKFKVVVLPTIPEVASALQSKQRGQDDKSVEDVFEPYFGTDPTWFKQLPFIEFLGVDEHWQEQIGHGDNRATIQKAVSDLAVCMSGLDMLMYSPIVNALRKKAVEIMERPDMKGHSIIPGQGDNFDKNKAMAFVMELVQSLPEATNYQISSADIQTLIMNTFSGSGDIPESFSKVFSPDMIDEDCLDAVIEMPGIGDVLSPIMAGMESQTKGHTGKPAFSAVPTPGWMKRDGDSE